MKNSINTNNTVRLGHSRSLRPAEIKDSGFSIIEVSIALAIIALLVSTVIAGQNIKSRLELNQVVEDIGNIFKAVEIFKKTYGGMPGDLWNAQSAFGAANTSNGNGNEVLNTGSPNETLLFWQHLQLASLIEGTYDGVSAGPAGQKTGSLKYSIYSAETDFDAENLSLTILFSKYVGSPGKGILTTKQAYDFDVKYDDSDPANGSIRAQDGSDVAAQDCVTVSNTYNLSNKDNTPCALRFYLEQ